MRHAGQEGGRSGRGNLWSTTPKAFLGPPKGLLPLLGVSYGLRGACPSLPDPLEEIPSRLYSFPPLVPEPHGQSWEAYAPGKMGPRRRRLVTWVREAKPRSLAQDVAFGVCAGQVPVGCRCQREGVGDCEHEAQQPRDAERQQHLPEGGRRPSYWAPPLHLPTPPREGGQRRESSKLFEMRKCWATNPSSDNRNPLCQWIMNTLQE